MPQKEMPDMKALFEATHGKLEDKVQELIDLLDNVDCGKMLVGCFLAGRIKNVQPSDNPMTARIELLAEYCVGRFGNDEPKFKVGEKVEACMEILDVILAYRSFEILSASGADENSSPEITRLAALNNSNVRGSAYFSQLENRIVGIQVPLDNWYQDKLGITPSRILEVIKRITDEAGKNFEKFRQAANDHYNGLAPQQIDLTNFSDLAFEHIPVDLTSFVSTDELPIVSNLLFFSDAAQEEGKAAQQYPIVSLPDGRILMGQETHVLDCLWARLDDIIKQDRRVYDKRYQRNKAKWLEKVAIEYLKRIFPESDIYETLDYKLAGKDKGKDTAELDAAVKWGNFVLLIEAKAKDYPPLAQQGDRTKLRTALKKNVEDAFVQSLRAENEIRSNESVTFTERSTKRELILKSEDVHKIYPVSLSLHHLVGISTRLHQANELGLFNNGAYPFSICASDLDSITKCDIGPEVLLHYIEQRLDIMNGREGDWLGDEHDLFSAYLDTRLIKQNIEERSGGTDFDMISFSGYSDMFDKLEIYEHGGIIESPNTSIKIPDVISKIISSLCSVGTGSSRSVAFILLGLEDRLLNTLAHVIESAGTDDFDSKQNRSFTVANEDAVVTVLFLSTSTSKDEVEGKTLMRCSLEKYRRKLNKGVAIAIKPARIDRGYECAVVEVGEWQEDPKLEKLAAEHPPTPVLGAKLPERNEKCFCGSGKKFKKCCLHRIEAERYRKRGSK